jgi:nucleoside-diphosphate-sugar epimerase
LKVLVTGSTGFFGKAIVLGLQQAGHQVVGAARKSNATVQYLDISSKESCEQILSKNPGFDAIVHCAAIAHANAGQFSSQQYYLTNAEGAKNLIDAAVSHGVKRFIHISSASVYGEFDLPTLVSENSPTNPMGDYGVTKKMAEDFCLQRKDEIHLCIFRMATMYGKDWLFNIRRKVTPPGIGKYSYLTFNGESPRYSLCSNKNGADAVLWAIEGKMDAGIYNVADAYDYSLYDILGAVRKIEGKKLHIDIPKGLSSFILKLFVRLSPTAQSRLNAYSRYWKFFEPNLYSTDKLKSKQFNAHPDLLDMASE